MLEIFSDEELSVFCFDYFADVYNGFTAGQTKGQRIQFLIEYCLRHDVLSNLTTALQRARPEQYAKRFSAIVSPLQLDKRERDPKQVFVSHAHQDSEFAHRLAHDLAANGWKVWVVPESIQPGEKWVEAIDRGLAESGAFIAVLTPDAVSSRWMQTEIGAAIDLEHQNLIRLIPVELKSCTVPILWARYQRITFNHQYETDLPHLLQALAAPVDGLVVNLPNSGSKPLAIELLFHESIRQTPLLLDAGGNTETPPIITKAVPLDLSILPTVTGPLIPVTFLELLHKFEGHQSEINSVALSPDTKWLGCGLASGEIWIWQMSPDYPLVRKLKKHDKQKRSVNSLAFWPDGSRLLEGSEEPVVRLWNSETGKVIVSRDVELTVNGVAASNYWQLVAIANDKGIFIDMYQEPPKPGQVVFILMPASKSFLEQPVPMTCVAFSKQLPTLLAGGAEDGTISVWTVHMSVEPASFGTISCNLVRTLENPDGKIYSVTFSPDGSLIAGGSDAVIKVWQVQDGRIQKTIGTGPGQVRSVAFSPDGTALLAASSSQIIELWRVSDWQSTHHVGFGHTARVNSVAFSTDGQLIISGSDDGTARVWKAPAFIGGPLQDSHAAKDRLSRDGKQRSGFWSWLKGD